MMYLYLGKNTIKVLAMSKTLLGQFNISHFAKTHSSDFIKEGKPQSTDLIASAIKEAVTQAKPEAISTKDVTLILPQEAFAFGRYEVPTDISDSAIEPFIKDKVRNDLKISLDDTYHDYIVNKKDGKSTIFFYAIDKATFETLSSTMQLVQLKIGRIVPETLSYYTLFEKTLRKDKLEHILYATYNEDSSSAYLYDTHGLVKDDKFYITGKVKDELKKLVSGFDKEGTKINRLILSGTQSKTVRQDLFTKDVGAWTNPLEKIIDNFYKDYVKMIIPDKEAGISLLEYDMCFGAYIFAQEHASFTLTQQPMAIGSSKMKLPKIGMNFGFIGAIFNVKTLGIFAVSFVLSFGIIFGLSQFTDTPLITDLSFGGSEKKVEEEATPTPEPTAEPSPTPSVNREDLAVRILNGSGTPGKAGEMQDILTEAGYTETVTGNADSFDYETTEIQLKEEVEDALSLLQDDLSDYIDITDAETLDADDDADVVIIIGTDFE